MKKNLFKKVAALVTATSMIASLGTVAFAENYSGTGINITSVNAQKAVNNDGAVVDGVYDVTVSYEVANDVTNAIGVTMLAYAGENLSVDAKGYTKYNDSMQIVGIDQQEQTAQTGTFEFRVTTKGDAADAIKVTYDVPSIILVSGDNVTPAAAMFTITEPAWVADKAEYTGITEFDVEWPYDEAAIKQAIVKNVSINDIKLSKSGTGKETQFSSIGTVTEESFAVVKTGDTYSVTFTFPSDAVVDGAELDSKLTSVSIGEIVVNKKAWTVTSTSYGSDNKMTISSQGSLADVKSAVEAKLAEVGVTVKGSEEGMTKTIKTVTVGDFTVAGGAAYDDTCTDDQIVTGSVTADISGDTEVTVADSEKLTFELEVTVKSAAAAKWEIVSAEMSGSAITFNDQESTVTAGSLLTDITTEVHSRTATLKGANTEETENVSLATATVAVEDASKFIYTVTIPASVGATLANIPAEGYAFDITVVVNYKKPAVVYGDITGDTDENGKEIGDGEVAMNDVNKAFQYAMGNIELEDWQKTAANVATAPADEEIAMNDVNSMFQYAMGNISKFPVEGE